MYGRKEEIEKHVRWSSEKDGQKERERERWQIWIGPGNMNRI